MFSDLAQVYVDAFQVATTRKVTAAFPAPRDDRSSEADRAARSTVLRPLFMRLVGMLTLQRATAPGTGIVSRRLPIPYGSR